jgi:hypothetical protein
MPSLLMAALLQAVDLQQVFVVAWPSLVWGC